MTATVSLPVIPATCGDCPDFERWNDGSCLAAGEAGRVNAERTEPPPDNCPRRHACPNCGRYGDDR